MSVDLGPADGPAVDGEWVRVCGTDEMPDESAVAVDIDGEPVCLARSRGCWYALRDECSHEEVPLSEGDVSDGSVECWLHGSRFDLATGRPTGLPATEPVEVFPVRVEGDDVYVAVKG